MKTSEMLESLAANLWWSWNPEVLGLFQQLNPEVYQSSGHAPVATLRAALPAVLEDASFKKQVKAVYEAFETYMNTPGKYAKAPRTSYFCMEYGLHESLPTYSGGLGILAGDHAKATSDLGIPFTGIGLFLKEGYFRQHFDANGWQQDDHPQLDPSQHPLYVVRNDDGSPVTATVTIGHQPVHLKAWRLDVGKTRLFLLDADLESNPPELRMLTHKLYQGGNELRLKQEIILGIGGVRMLRALGIETDVYHMNEGHCAFLTLELLRERMDLGERVTDAEAWVRERSVFTTHTPVPAGHDRFWSGRLLHDLASFRSDLGFSEGELMDYGRVESHEDMFTMTVLGLKMSRQANGVSALNGEVARDQWKAMFPDRSVDDVPIAHITNGVHVSTWAVPTARAFLEERLGDWKTNLLDPGFWAKLSEVSDEELWQYRTTLRKQLLDFIAARMPTQTLHVDLDLDPEALTIGFARRFATYKRAPLLFHDVERAAQLFADTDRPVQIIYAGKAHPADEGGKRFIQRIYEMSQHEAFRGKVVFLENYNIEVGRMLVSGCDVWLNNPRRPMEASGTSGQKIAVHGGLNVSILDGWWPEGYDGTNGWPIGNGTSFDDVQVQDDTDALALYNVLQHQVIPTFYRRTTDGLPVDWVARMRSAMMSLTRQFSALRMVSNYIDEMYAAPAPEVIG